MTVVRMLVMYKIEKLTVKNRCEIPVGGVVEIEVNEDVHIHSEYRVLK